MKKFTNGMVELIETPSNTKNELYVSINLDGRVIFVPHGSAVMEKWHDGQSERKKVTKIWATEKANKGNLWKIEARISEDKRLIQNNGSFDHFLEFVNVETEEVAYGGTTVGNPMYDYSLVTKERAFLVAD